MIIYKTIEEIKEPLIFVKDVKVKYGEIVKIKDEGVEKFGKVIAIDENYATIEVFEGTSGLSKASKVIPTDKLATLPVSANLIGKVLNGLGKPINGEEIIGEEEWLINGKPLNPYFRKVPSEFIQTGITGIDLFNSIIRGQKIAIFSSPGLPIYKIASSIVKNSTLLTGENFIPILATIGINHEIENFLLKELKDKLSKAIVILNKASHPTMEQLTAPRVALTIAEYFAYRLNFHTLVILIDMTNYCNALREASLSKKEIPTRRGYPGYLFSDLASIYERCGVTKDGKGSVTVLPILTMPNNDISHPVIDTTGYITEGQIILDSSLYKKGIYPPIDILPSLSRLMHKGIGEGKTLKYHKEISDQIYSLYSEGVKLRKTALVLGIDVLSERDQKLVKFANEVEMKLIKQEKERSIYEDIKIAKELLREIDEEDLYLLPKELIKEIKSSH